MSALRSFPPRLAALCAALLMLAAMLVLDASERERAVQAQRMQVMERVAVFRAKLESGVNVAVAATRSLAVAYTLNPALTHEEFDRHAREILSSTPQVRNIGLSRDTLVTYVYPQQGNEAALGLDYRDVPSQWPAYERMMRNGESSLAGPLALAQGGVAAIVRIPVFYQSPQGSRAFIGAVSSPLMLDRLLADAGLPALETDIAIALRGRDALGTEGEVFYGDATLFGNKPVLREVTLPGGSWQIAAVPRTGWQGVSPVLWALRSLTVLLVLLAAALAYGLTSYLQRHKEHERQLAANEARLKQQSTELIHQNAVLEMITHQAPLPDILEMLAQLVELHNPKLQCAILLLDADRQHLRRGAAPSLPAFFSRALDGLPARKGSAACTLAVMHGESVIIEDMHAHDYPETLRSVIEEAGLRACWAQPIKNHTGEVLGTFALYRHQPGTPDAEERAMIANYATLAGLAIERSRTTEALRLHDAALNFIPTAIFIADREARIVWANQAFSDLTGYAVEEARGHHCNELFNSGHQNRSVYEEMWHALLVGRNWHGTLVNRRKDGTLYHDEMTIAPIYNDQHEITHFVALKQDVSARMATEEDLKSMAFYDPLTRLPNRRLLLDRLHQAQAAGRRSKRHGALMFIDLDNFKPLNDEHGHDVGDLLLMEVAQRITHCLRAEDTVARFGGDEFVVLLAELDTDVTLSGVQAGAIAEKIRNALAQPYQLELLQAEANRTTIEHHCTSSIGIATFLGTEHDAEELLRQADVAMYQAKAAGRNTIRFSA